MNERQKLFSSSFSVPTSSFLYGGVMSIATKAGDRGQTGLIGGVRVAKSDLRVEAYGTIDELTAALGFARALCADEEVRELTKGIQRELFAVSGAIANPASTE